MIKSVLFVLVVFVSSTTLFSQNEVIDKIIAQVGDNIILLSDIESQKIQAVQAGVEVTSMMDCSVLEQLMSEELYINQAKLDSLVITDEQVGEIINIRTMDEFKNKLDTYNSISTLSRIKDAAVAANKSIKKVQLIDTRIEVVQDNVAF
jgi:peptidyl-prolyl cis-trans isomerase SurA